MKLASVSIGLAIAVVALVSFLAHREGSPNDPVADSPRAASTTTTEREVPPPRELLRVDVPGEEEEEEDNHAAAALLVEYEFELSKEPRDQQRLIDLLRRMARVGSTTQAWSALREVVEWHGESTPDQILTAEATRQALDLYRSDPDLMDNALFELTGATQASVIHFLSQSLAMARSEGRYQDSISLEIYSAYQNTDSWLARQTLIGTAQNIGDAEWIVRMFEDDLARHREVFHPAPETRLVSPTVGLDKLFKYEQKEREAGRFVDSRPALRDAIVSAATDASISAPEWVSLYRMAQRHIPEAAAEILRASKPSDPAVDSYVQYYRATAAALDDLEEATTPLSEPGNK